MKKITHTILLIVGLLLTISLHSREPIGSDNVKDNNKIKELDPTLAANCSPAQRIAYLDYNNVRALIETGGLMWQNRAEGQSSYEVPKKPLESNEPRTRALYSGGLWMAGQDINGQLKAAVSQFGAATDYWTGPLTNGIAEITPDVCDKYDRFFQVTRAQVAEFVDYNRAKAEGTAANEYPGYTIPQGILNWPGNNEGSNMDIRLAPFVDVDNDLIYDPVNSGDYPYYDLDGNDDCRAPRLDRSENANRPLFGDVTYWWVFNDKGNLHTESGAPPIGMEIHAQAFAFATNDEINNMTFYNYELINRSTFTLTNTYFASWVDPDLGYAFDDYVGCDVERGLGYCYNGDNLDEAGLGQPGYGTTPPAIGVDFFEGPYQDNDGKDNPLTRDVSVAIKEGGIPYSGIGIGYGDGVIDNERFGMRKFVYYNNAPGAQNGDPQLPAQYYQYMTGFWKNNQRMRYGGNAYNSPGVENIPTDYMFVGQSDPVNWATLGNPPANTNWTEDNPGGGEPRNPEGDRRFLQSAGPFTLLPGNVNDITVGVVYARAESGGNRASIADLLVADDKAQALFDNCFQVLNGPDAPDVTYQELDQEVILYLTNNRPTSNNYLEKYNERDPNIITPDTTLLLGYSYDSLYRFEGYQIYQLKGPEVSIEDLDDQSLARLVVQTDIKNRVGRLVNFEFDKSIGANRPYVMTDSVDEGIRHSFSIKTDLFAQGDNRLVNYKTYYFIAIAYGYNQFKPYLQDAGISYDLSPASNGQRTPYIASRRSSVGGSVESFAVIPHKVKTENSGTQVNSQYGDRPRISRIEGRGNGGNRIKFTNETLNRITDSADADPFEEELLRYRDNFAPIDVFVADPLNVQPGDYFIQVLSPENATSNIVTPQSKWRIWREHDGIISDTILSDTTLSIETEQLLINPNMGFSVKVNYGALPGKIRNNNGFLGADIEFADPNKPWLRGVQDQDGFTPYNWIRSGTFDPAPEDHPVAGDYKDTQGDPDQVYETVLGGIIAPYKLVAYEDGDGVNVINNAPGFSQTSRLVDSLAYLHSVQIVFTKDKSKWTRCPVLETQETKSRAVGQAERLHIRKSPSIDKNGNFYNGGGISNNPNDPGFIDTTGMGWFPGYAVDIETGKRLNMAYGEDSFYGTNNGADMQWNPTEVEVIGTTQFNLQYIWGGKHYVYIFRETPPVEYAKNAPPSFADLIFMPAYDYGKKLTSMFKNNTNFKNFAWRSCSWVMIPMLEPNQELLSTDAIVTVNVNKPLDTLRSDFVGENAKYAPYSNEGRPVYTFNADNLSVSTNQTVVLEETLDEINVVPNPYYAYAEYETSRNDNLVKIINLPEVCTIKIYNMNGTLIREYNKADPTTFVDWDLNNFVNIPISSGVYIIHVNVPDVGEKVLKWFGVMRPTDLNTF